MHPLDAAHALRAYGLTLPEATEDYPWGERVLKVNGKVFVFLGMSQSEDVGMSLKLPTSGAGVLTHPWAKPTGYGLGKSGWVSITLKEGEVPDEAVLRAWLRESYVAVAPKRLGKQVSGV